MPTLRPCCEPGCPTLVERGRCATHTRQREQRRGTSSARGYGAAWEAFRQRFIDACIALGIAPICGAALPDGPSMASSRCKAAGLVNGSDLALHHDPPLADWERTDSRRVCDERRVGWLCRSCHNATHGYRGGR